MQLLKTLSFIALTVSTALATIPPIPPLYFVGTGQATALSANAFSIDGPLGHRISGGFSGGTFTDHNGHPLGKLLGDYSIENGIIDPNNFLHVDARSTWKLADGNYSYVTFQGIGPAGAYDWAYLAFETASTQFGYLNNIFVLANVTTVAPGSLNIDLWTTNPLPSN